MCAIIVRFNKFKIFRNIFLILKEIQVAEVNEEEERIRIDLLPEVIDKRWLPAFYDVSHRCFCDKFIIRSEIKCFSCIQ